MKKVIVASFFLLMVSCAKKESRQAVAAEDFSTVAPYDTVAIDSFSAGATSVDIARKIRISSQQFQDSLREVGKKRAAEIVTQKETAEKEMLEKKLAEEKKKADPLKAKKTKPSANPEIPLPATSTNP